MITKKTMFLYILFLCFSNLFAANYKGENYFLKKGYIARGTYTHYDDTALKDEFQDEVYLAAYELAKTHQYQTIADIGCGSAYKLLKYFADCNTVGFEISPTLEFLKKAYPSRDWRPSDFSTKSHEKFDVIICSDVIEHLVDPDRLLSWIEQFNFEYLVLSTPDRDQLIHLWTDAIYGPQSQSGPPVNIAHVREWSFEEFEKYVGQYFDIVEHFHCKREFYGQVIVARKKIGS
jgi:hypothetical protein